MQNVAFPAGVPVGKPCWGKQTVIRERDAHTWTNGRTGQSSTGGSWDWIEFNLLMLIDPALGFLKSHLIRLTFRVAELIRFTLDGFHGPSAAR